MNKYLLKFINENFSKPGKALDLGAGDLKDVRALLNMGWDCQGVDKINNINLEHVFLGENRPYDLVYSNYVIHKIIRKDNFVKTIYENLKPGGRLFLHTFHKYDKTTERGITKGEIRKLLKASRFDSIKIRIIVKYDSDHKHWHRLLEATAIKDK